MKHILLSVYILLTFSFFVQTKTYAQEEMESTNQITVEQETVEETLQPPTTLSLTTPQILLSILAPSTFIVIGYLMIKKLKL